MSREVRHALIFLLLCRQCKTSEPNVGFRIVGGETCDVEDHPYIISIRYAGRLEHLCGGSLIHPLWVLTAAHCTTTYSTRELIVVGGASIISAETSSAQFRRVDKFLTHPNFNYTNFQCDVALMLLKTEFILDKYVNVIKLPAPGFTNSCERSTTMGWGSEKVPTSVKHLKCVTLPLIDLNKCSDLYGEFFDDGAICTLYRPGGKDACAGDSGGPLVCNDVLIGIVSKGRGCALPNMPGVYARTEHFLDFIEKSITMSDSRMPKGEVTFSRILLIAIVSIMINV